MTDLPMPVAPVANGGVPDPAGMAPASPALAGNPAALQDRATEQTEAAILQTTTNPAERAVQIHAIKAAYIKAVYGINTDGSA
jgi:hypothetical protein